MNLKVTILGCGNSTGVPAIGNYWGKCDPEEPKNRRTRCSLLIQSETTNLVVDSGPDFKSQINNVGINHIEAVLYTHGHSDHVDGIGELRVIKFLGQKEFVPIYCNKQTLSDLEQRFSYLFKGGDSDLYPPVLQPHVLDDQLYTSMSVGDIGFTPFVQDHGTCDTIGYRFGDMGYSVDILTLDDKAVEVLRGVRTWIVDCAGYGQTSNPVHANLEGIMRLNERIGAQQVYLVSLTLAADYQTMLNELPDGYAPAYDGLELSVEC